MKQIIVHYGELSTKGRNRKMFQNRLADHLRYKIKPLDSLVKVTPLHDFMYVEWPEADYDAVIQVVKHIPGIARFEPAYQVPQSLAEIIAKALELFGRLHIHPGDSFKVVAKRSDKRFEHDTLAIQREVGGAIFDAFPQLSVDLKQPTYKLTVSIHQDDAAYLSLDSYQGLQGMPFSSGGKGMLMLSGGFDSPIAGYLMLKRGMELEMVHFASPPYTSPQALEKAKKLTGHLARYSMPMVFHTVPFTKVQEAIRDHIHDNESMTVMRRMMLRITDRLMAQRKGQAIINGESLGQVASQTLTSMQVINQVTRTPILRPLIATDKNDIIELAEQIGTYAISNEPYEDCCTVFAPKSPHTKPKLSVIEALEARLDIEALIAHALAGVITEEIGEDYLNHSSRDFEDLL